jgi:hypothetical protein
MGQAPPPMRGSMLMMEQTEAGEDHDHAVFVRGAAAAMETESQPGGRIWPCIS